MAALHSISQKNFEHLKKGEEEIGVEVEIFSFLIRMIL